MVDVGIDDAPPVHGDEAPGQAPLLDATEPLERSALALPRLHPRPMSRLVRFGGRTEHRVGLSIARDHDAFPARSALHQLRRTILQLTNPNAGGGHDDGHNSAMGMIARQPGWP